MRRFTAWASEVGVFLCKKTFTSGGSSNKIGYYIKENCKIYKGQIILFRTPNSKKTGWTESVAKLENRCARRSLVIKSLGQHPGWISRTWRKHNIVMDFRVICCDEAVVEVTYSQCQSRKMPGLGRNHSQIISNRLWAIINLHTVWDEGSVLNEPHKTS